MQNSNYYHYGGKGSRVASNCCADPAQEGAENGGSAMAEALWRKRYGGSAMAESSQVASDADVEVAGEGGVIGCSRRFKNMTGTK